MGAVEPLEAVASAAKVLIPNFREVAFEVAVQAAVHDKVLTNEQKTALETIAAKLAVDREYVQGILGKYT